jgi:hypothetical protein
MSEPRCRGRCKSKFSAEEDAQLLEIVSHAGCRDWSEVAMKLSGRNPRQCRERWNNYVNPTIKTAPWTDAEEGLLESKFAELGPRWQVIAPLFQGRSRNQVKNHWMTKQRRLNKKRRDEQQAIARERPPETRILAPPPIRIPAPPDPADDFFPPDPNAETIWEMMSLEYL